MPRDRAQHVAQDDRATCAREEERLDAEVIAGGDEHATVHVPDAEREVAEQMLRAGGTPLAIRGGEHLDVRRRAEIAPGVARQPLAEGIAIVEPAVERDDEAAVVEKRAAATGVVVSRSIT